MKVSLLGAGGHARSLIALLESQGIPVEGIYDDSYKPNETIFSYPVKGSFDQVPPDASVVLAVGDSSKRAALYNRFRSQVVKDSLVHATARVESYTQIGSSNQLFATTLINAGCVIGDNNIINSHAVLEHEVKIGSHNHISVGTILCGRVEIGDNCFIGAGAVIIDKIQVANRVIIGASAVVIHDILESGTYVGNPVRKLP